MSDMNGEETLLKLFEDTNVPLQNYCPTVIRSWFDIDDEDEKELLNWMCTSLSTANYVSSLDVEMNVSIKNEVTEQDLIRVEQEHPGILNVEGLEMETKRLQNEIHLALREEQRLDESISEYKTLENQLSAEYQSNIRTQAKATVKFEIAKESCNTSAKKLDESHNELLEWYHECGKCLYVQRFDPIPKFLNDIAVENLQEKFNSLIRILEILVSNADANNSTMLNETLNNLLFVIKNRIHKSQKDQIISNVQKEETQAMLNYLRMNDISDILSLTEDLQGLYEDVEALENRKWSLSNKLEEVAHKITDSKVSKIVFGHKQQELQFHQNRFESINKVEDLVVKSIFMYSVVNILCKLEGNDIDNASKCTKYITSDVTNRIKNCSRRIDKMQEVITDYQLIPEEKRFHLIHSIAKIISKGHSFSLHKTFNTLINLKRELNQTEMKVYSSLDHVVLKNLRGNISTLQSFLMSGPTCQPVLVPSVLQVALKEMEGELEKHDKALAYIVSLYNDRKQCSKWEKYRQQLWMFFYMNPHKLKFVMDQIEMELTRRLNK